MTITARLDALVTLTVTATIHLFWVLFWPVLIGVTAHLVFGPDATPYSIIAFTCFVWGATGVWLWWRDVTVTLNTIIKPRPAIKAHRRW